MKTPDTVVIIAKSFYDNEYTFDKLKDVRQHEENV